MLMFQTFWNKAWTITLPRSDNVLVVMLIDSQCHHTQCCKDCVFPLHTSRASHARWYYGKRCCSSVLFRFVSHILCFNFGSVLCEFGGLTVLIILQWLLKHLAQFFLQKKTIYIWGSKKDFTFNCWKCISYRWLAKHAMNWVPSNGRRRGRPRNTWPSTYREDLRNMNLSWDSAQTTALDRTRWRTVAARYAETHRRT